MKGKLGWIDVWAVVSSVAVVAGFTFVCLLAWSLVAHGQSPAATQPASQPAIVLPSGLWPWFTSNASWLIPVIVWTLSTVCTGLSDYPKAGGVVKALRMIMAGLSVVQFRNAPGSLKLPVSLPSAPPEPPKA